LYSVRDEIIMHVIVRDGKCGEEEFILNEIPK
jgi:hypothetical protein